jgi:hypothetical protein
MIELLGKGIKHLLELKEGSATRAQLASSG